MADIGFLYEKGLGKTLDTYNKLQARVNRLKDYTLPRYHKHYLFAKKQLIQCVVKPKRCIADWKVFRTTIDIYIKAYMDLQEAESELRKVKLELSTLRRTK